MNLTSITARAKSAIESLHEKGAFYIFLGNFATKFVTFFGSVFLSNIITKNDMGILSYMENLCSYAYIFVGLGMANAVLRYVVLAETQEEKLAYAAYSLKRGLFFDIIIVLAVIIINIFYPHGSSYQSTSWLIYILILALPFQDMLNQVQMNERALFNNKRFAIISVGSGLAIVLARIIGAKAAGLTGIVVGILLANVVLGLSMQLMLKNREYDRIEPIELSTEKKKVASQYAFQYMITNSLWSIFMLMDMFLLGKLLDDPTAVADYKIAYAFPVNMSIFSSAIGIFIVPYFVKNENNASWVKKNYKKTMGATILILGLVSVSLIILARPLIRLYGEPYINVVPLMRLLVISCFVDNVFRYPIANILAAIGKIQYNMVASACGLVAQTMLNIIFIPKYGGYALPFTNIAVHFLMAVALFVFFNKSYHIIGDSES